MIEFTKSYKTADGQIFGSIEDAQRHELAVAIAKSTGAAVSADSANEIAGLVMEQKDVIVDILTMTPTSKPKARAIHGGTKTRKVKSSCPDSVVAVTLKPQPAQLGQTVPV